MSGKVQEGCITLHTSPHISRVGLPGTIFRGQLWLQQKRRLNHLDTDQKVSLYGYNYGNPLRYLHVLHGQCTVRCNSTQWVKIWRWRTNKIDTESQQIHNSFKLLPTRSSRFTHLCRPTEMVEKACKIHTNLQKLKQVTTTQRKTYIWHRRDIKVTPQLKTPFLILPYVASEVGDSGIDLLKVGIPKLTADSAIDRIGFSILEFPCPKWEWCSWWES